MSSAMSMVHSIEADVSNFKTAILVFDFYAAKYKDCEFILLEPQNKECCRYSMKLYAAISKWISEALGQPVAYFFDYRISDIWDPITAVSILSCPTHMHFCHSCLMTNLTA